MRPEDADPFVEHYVTLAKVAAGMNLGSCLRIARRFIEEMLGYTMLASLSEGQLLGIIRPEADRSRWPNCRRFASRRHRIKKRRKTLSVMTLHGSRQGITADLLYLHAASLLRPKLVESA